MPYLWLCRAFECMDSTTKRLRIGDVLANCFRAVLALSGGGGDGGGGAEGGGGGRRPVEEQVARAAYLLCGKIAPEYKGVELSVSLVCRRAVQCGKKLLCQQW